MKIFEKIMRWIGFAKEENYYLTLPEIKYKVEEMEKMGEEEYEKTIRPLVEKIEKIIEEIRKEIYEKYSEFIYFELIFSGSELVEKKERNVWSILIGIPETTSCDHKEILEEIKNLFTQKGFKVGKINKIKKK